MNWPSKRPEWCPHNDCQFLILAGQGRTCAGRLPKPEPHESINNTHRWCLDCRDSGHGIVDLQVYPGDFMWFEKAFNAIREDSK